MKKRILLVDDDPAIRHLLVRVLVEENYDALPAASAAEALELAGAARIDLMLLDLKLSGQSGWDIFEQITAKNPSMAVIIITGRPNQLFTALASGAGALMEKPLDVPKLLRAISELVAEPPSVRLARMAGRATGLRYSPLEDQEPVSSNCQSGRTSSERE